MCRGGGGNKGRASSTAELNQFMNFDGIHRYRGRREKTSRVDGIAEALTTRIRTIYKLKAQ